MKVAKVQNVAEAESVVSATEPVTDTRYISASKYIRSAIDELGKIAKDDVLAQESIANLGVVLLDLNK